MKQKQTKNINTFDAIRTEQSASNKTKTNSSFMLALQDMQLLENPRFLIEL